MEAVTSTSDSDSCKEPRLPFAHDSGSRASRVPDAPSALKALSPACVSTFLGHSAPALLSSLEFLKVRCIFPPHSPLPPASPFLPSLPLVLCVAGSFLFPRSRFQGRFPQRPRLTIVSKIAPPPNYPLSRHLGSRLVIFTAHNYLLFTVCLFMASLPQRGASRTKAGIRHRHRRALIFACSSRKADAEARIQVPAV